MTQCTARAAAPAWAASRVGRNARAVLGSARMAAAAAARGTKNSSTSKKASQSLVGPKRCQGCEGVAARGVGATPPCRARASIQRPTTRPAPPTQSRREALVIGPQLGLARWVVEAGEPHHHGPSVGDVRPQCGDRGHGRVVIKYVGGGRSQSKVPVHKLGQVLALVLDDGAQANAGQPTRRRGQRGRRRGRLGGGGACSIEPLDPQIRPGARPAAAKGQGVHAHSRRRPRRDAASQRQARQQGQGCQRHHCHQGGQGGCGLVPSGGGWGWGRGGGGPSWCTAGEGGRGRRPHSPHPRPAPRPHRSMVARLADSLGG